MALLVGSSLMILIWVLPVAMFWAARPPPAPQVKVPPVNRVKRFRQEPLQQLDVAPPAVADVLLQ
jgi:hypothetical protein